MTEFWLISGAMIVAALAFVLPPLLRSRPNTSVGDTRDLNIRLYHEQLRELEADLEIGRIRPEQFDAARADLEAADHSFLAHHFDSIDQQFDAGKLGMWIFLVTEVLFFGGLFVAYAVYRSNHPEVFAYAHQYLDKTLGALNTVVLVFSSLTISA